MAAALLGDKQARIWRWTLAVMEEQRNQFGFQQNAECTRTCRAFRASRRFAASRPPRDFTLSLVDRQDTKSTARADLLQRSQLGCMSDQGSFASISSCPLPCRYPQ